MSIKHEFDFDMACDGCYNAARKVLGKIGIADSNVTANVPNKKLYVVSDKPKEELLETIAKTGKKVEYVGVVG